MITLFSNIKSHWSHYVALLAILAFGIFSFWFFRRTPQAQVFSAFLTASFYVAWGTIHHYLEGDLHLRVILEYVAVALLGFLILFSAVNRV